MRLPAVLRSKAGLNTLIYLGATVGTSGMGFLTALLMTHLLAPEQYGRTGIFLSILYIAVPLVSLAAEGLVAVNRTTLSAPEYESFRRTVVALGLAAFVALQTLALVLFGSGVVRDALMLVIPLFALIRLMTTMAGTEYVSEQKAGTYAVLMLLNAALAMAFTYALMKWGSASADSRVLALMAAELVVLVARYRGRMHLILKPRIDPKYRRQILAFGVPSLIALFGAWGLNESDKVVVAHGCGLGVTGLYTAAATLAAVMMNFNQSLTNALFPSFFEALKNKRASVSAVVLQYVVKFLGLSAVFAGLLTLGYLAIKDTLLPEKYAIASKYFYALVAASLTVAAFRPLSLASEYFKMGRARAIAITVGGGATVSCAAIGVLGTGEALWAPVGIAVGYLVAGAIIAYSVKEMGQGENLNQ